MTRYQHRSLEPLQPEHTLRGVVEELRAAERPPGAHITFPDVAWPEAAAEPPPPMQPARLRDIPLPIGMIEPEEEPASGLAPVVFWLVILVAFACVLAEAGGLL